MYTLDHATQRLDTWRDMLQDCGKELDDATTMDDFHRALRLLRHAMQRYDFWAASVKNA